MGNIRPFQLVFMGIFVFLALATLVFLSIFDGGGEETINNYGDSVVIWGTLDRRAINNQIDAIAERDKNFDVVSYIQFDIEEIETQFVNALAEARGPDLILISSDQLVSLRSKLQPISYDTLRQRTYRDTYVDGAEVFARTDGVYALPLAMDPLVLYWNRTIFANNSLVAPPKTWEELRAVTTPTITRSTPSFDVLTSAVALGEFGNVRRAKEVMLLLMLQAGAAMVEEGELGYSVGLNDLVPGNTGLPPAEAALSFYTDFAKPTSLVYSWNRSLPEDRSQFLSGDLAMYFDYGSQYESIANANPNLNFDIAPVPQGAGATTLRNYAQFYGFAITRGSQNQAGAYRAALMLSSANSASSIIGETALTPVHRTLVANGTTNPVSTVRYGTAFTARGWLDPDPVVSLGVFETMIEDVTSGRMKVGNAVDDAERRLESAF